MVLHHTFIYHESSQDTDSIYRTFSAEYHALGFTDAEERFRSCIAETPKFNLGADWMNDHSDVALPMALECVPCLSSPLLT